MRKISELSRKGTCTAYADFLIAKKRKLISGNQRHIKYQGFEEYFAKYPSICGNTTDAVQMPGFQIM